MKESAYVLSVTAAGVVYEVTKACSKGQHHLCGCDKSTKDQANFTWAGCSDNVHFGIAFAERFLDVREKRRKKNKKLQLVNLHNNRVGRDSVEGVMETRCRCHGVSGSCELKTCWRALPNFRVFGKFLQERYKKIHLVDYANNQLIPRSQRRITDHRNLVYLVASPRFCVEDPRSGSLGTRGRRCNATASTWNSHSCRDLCCGRGHTSDTFEVDERCRCKFRWCCEVVCQTCRRRVQESTCN